MNRIVQLLFILISTIGWSQNQHKIFYHDHVECFFDNYSGNELGVYDKIDGNILKSLIIDEKSKKYSWFKIAIQETKDGWAKIENIMIAPTDADSINMELFKLKNCWIKIENLKVNMRSPTTKFYKAPNSESEIICKAGNYSELYLIETNGLWVKVSFVLDQIKYKGWIKDGDYCAYPWTACP